MKKLIYTFFVLYASIAFAQSTSSPKPFILADQMIANSDFLEKQTKNIKEIHVYKNAENLPKSLKGYISFAKNGIISATLKENYYDRVSLENLNLDHQLPADNPVYFDGNLITNTQLHIVGDVLAEMKVGVTNGKKVLNIWSTKQSMHQIAK